MPDQHDKRTERTKKVLLTGGSGFIGGHIARYFVSQGLDVTCLVRENSNTRFIADLPVTMIPGDITDPESLVFACKGMDAVIHTAAKVGDWGDYRRFYEVNVTGTENVLKASLRNNVPKVILTGSVSSYGEEDYPGLKNESSPFNSHYRYFLDGCLPSGLNYYRDTKAACTVKAKEIARQFDMNVIVVEPVWVYGENEFNSGFYEYLRSLKSGMLFMPGSRTNQFHVIYAADLARAYYLAYLSDLKGFHRIIIGNRQPENMFEIYSLFARAAGLREPKLLPRPIAYSAGLMLEILWTVFRVKTPPLLTRARVNMFYDNIGYATGKAAELIGFEATTPLSEGIEKTVKWYVDNQYL